MLKKLIITTAILSLCWACTDEREELMVSATRGNTDTGLTIEMFTPKVSGRTVSLSARLLYTGDKTVKKSGFAYSNKNPEPQPKSGVNSLYKTAKIGEDSLFSASISNLTEDVTYYARAYCISTDADTVYSEIFSFMAQSVNPSVTTMPVLNRARMGAVVFAKFNTVGTKTVKSWGVCLSHHPLPTIEDTMEKARDTCKIKGYEGEFGAFFQNLQPATLYHVRAYVITDKGDAYYGEDRLFRTTEGGQCTWHWASNAEGAKSAGAYDRITEAMDSAMYYYNNYSNLYISSSVEYNSGVQTADCSLGGWIRFGANSRYQWVGTAQHELNHGLGGGTCGNWSSMFTSGAWNKPITQRTARAVMHDQTQEIHGDSQHFWPCGINQREEVTNGSNSYGEAIKDERMLRANAMVFNAMRLDGLWNHY